MDVYGTQYIDIYSSHVVHLVYQPTLVTHDKSPSRDLCNASPSVTHTHHKTPRLTLLGVFLLCKNLLQKYFCWFNLIVLGEISCG